jgi:hypothetical protein
MTELRTITRDEAIFVLAGIGLIGLLLGIAL